jgi:hypothetical protein
MNTQFESAVEVPLQEKCSCDRTSELHYQLTRYVVGIDKHGIDNQQAYTCEYCMYRDYTKGMDFAPIEELATIFKSDMENLLKITRGPNNLTIFDMINEMIQMLDAEHDHPYLKNREHFAIMFRYQELDKIVDEFDSIMAASNPKNDNVKRDDCFCDRTSELHYQLTRYVAGFDRRGIYICDFCDCHTDCDTEMQFASTEEIVNLFKADHDYLLNLTFGPKKLKLFDMITDLKEILIDAHDMPYLKYSEHGAIMNRHHDLDNIVHELTIASA